MKIKQKCKKAMSGLLAVTMAVLLFFGLGFGTVTAEAISYSFSGNNGFSLDAENNVTATFTITEALGTGSMRGWLLCLFKTKPSTNSSGKLNNSGDIHPYSYSNCAYYFFSADAEKVTGTRTASWSGTSVDQKGSGKTLSQVIREENWHIVIGPRYYYTGWGASGVGAGTNGIWENCDYYVGMATEKISGYSFTAPAAVAGLVYNANQQTLITAGSTSDGTLQYALGTDSATAPTEGWGTSLPTAKNAGTYYVWYKTVGSTNPESAVPACVVVNIAKAMPAYTVPVGLTAVYGDTLGGVDFNASNWSWKTPDAKVGNVGENTFAAIFTPADPDNYHAVEVMLPVTVAKARPSYTLPEDLAATYGDTLADVILPAGWAWKDEAATSVGNVGENTFAAVFTPADPDNYRTVEVMLTVTVAKAQPSYTLPEDLAATYGDTLADVILPAGWTWKDAATSVGNVGENAFGAIFTPADPDNYHAVEVMLTVTVAKAQPSYTLPEDLMADCGDTLGDVTLPEGWVWKDAATTKVGNVGENTFVIVFVPADTNNYNTVEETVSLMVRDHVMSDATCTDVARCAVCGATDGEPDRTNHVGDTEIKNDKHATCGADGYTGDTYCKSCHQAVEAGTVIPATGEHTYGDWQEVKAPTKTEPGEKQRVCGVCGDVESQEVPMLPDLPATGDRGILQYGFALIASFAALAGLLFASKNRKAASK